jgi:lambda family phage portal protein
MTSRRMSFPKRILSAVAGVTGRFMAEADRQRYESLAQKVTGRLDHTWTARNSTMNRSYEAGSQNRSNADWRAGTTSATQAILDSLDVMLARSRWMIRNDGYANSAQAGYRRHVVGGGITARASARHPVTGEMLKGYNAAHDLLWNAWAMDPMLCDVEQTKCLYEKQALWMDELFAAGGLLLRPVYTPNKNNVGLAIQELEYEQLYTDLTSFGGNAVYNGIETNPYGAPLAYHVYAASHPLEEIPSTHVRLPASDCWQLFRKTRVRQRIGAPMMAAVMPALRNLAMYELYTISKARTEAAFHGVVKTGAGSTSTTDAVRKRIGAAPPTGESDEDLQLRVENGLFPRLKNDEELQFPPPGTPNTMYPSFVLENLKKIAAGSGLDAPTVSRWYAEGNFNTQRKAALETEAEVEAIQDLQFINGVLRHIRELWTEIAVRENKIAATGYRTSARWKAAYLTTNWQGPPRRSVDEIKDQAAWDMKYLSLRGTPQEWCNEMGRDVRDLLSEWKEFFDLAEEYKLSDVVRTYFSIGSPDRSPKAGKQPAGTDGDSDPADADSETKNHGKDDKPVKSGLSASVRNQLVLNAVMDSGDNGHGGNGHGSRF